METPYNEYPDITKLKKSEEVEEVETEEVDAEETEEVEEVESEETETEETEEEETEEVESETDEEESETEEVESETEETEETEEEEVDDEEWEEIDYAEETDGVFGSLEEIKEFAELLKDEFFKGAYDYYKANKTLKPYLEVMQFDPDSLSTEDLLRMELEQAYKDHNLSKADLDALFEDEVLKQFKMDGDESYEEREVRLGQIRADKKAAEIRKRLKDVKEKFTQPVREEQTVSKEDLIAERNKRRKSHSDSIGQVVKNDSFKVEISDGVDPIPVKVSRDKLIEYSMGFEKFAQDYLIKDGAVDYHKLADISAFASDPVKYRKDVFDHGFNNGKKALVNKDLKNKPVKEKGETERISTGGGDPYKSNPSTWKVKKK